MNIVSFGGGTNSAALLIGLYKHKIPIDLITFADTGAEHPHTYQFIEIINQWLAEHGMPQITVVQYVDRYGNRLSLETECLRSHTLPSIAYGHKRCLHHFIIRMKSARFLAEVPVMPSSAKISAIVHDLFSMILSV